MAQFSWASAFDVGLGLLGGVGKAVSALGASKDRQLEAQLSNELRAANNAVNRSRQGLAATVRTINNNRIMQGGADRLDVTIQNALRTQDSLAAGQFEDSIRAAEAQGASAVAAAASGVGGTGIEAISRTVALTSARQQAYADRRMQQAAGDAQVAARGIMPGALQSLELGPILGGQDYRTNLAPSTDYFGTLTSNLLEGLLSKKDSLQTMLGSLSPDVATSRPITVSGGAADFAFTYPVSQSTVTGVDLPSISLK